MDGFTSGAAPFGIVPAAVASRHAVLFLFAAVAVGLPVQVGHELVLMRQLRGLFPVVSSAITLLVMFAILLRLHMILALCRWPSCRFSS